MNYNEIIEKYSDIKNNSISLVEKANRIAASTSLTTEEKLIILYEIRNEALRNAQRLINLKGDMDMI